MKIAIDTFPHFFSYFFCWTTIKNYSSEDLFRAITRVQVISQKNICIQTKCTLYLFQLSLMNVPYFISCIIISALHSFTNSAKNRIKVRILIVCVLNIIEQMKRKSKCLFQIIVNIKSFQLYLQVPLIRLSGLSCQGKGGKQGMGNNRKNIHRNLIISFMQIKVHLFPHADDVQAAVRVERSIK